MSHRENLITDAIAGRSPSHKGYIRAACPICPYVIGTEDRHAALSVNANNGWYRCWRCGSKGRISGYGYGDEGSDSEADSPITLPEGYYSLEDSRCEGSLLAQQVRDYLARRLVTPEAAREAEIGFTVRGRYSHRIIVPVVDGDGSLVGWVGRSLDDNAKLRYIYPEGMERGEYLFNEAALSRTDSHPLLVVEGCFDALPYFPQACAVLGKPSAGHIRKLRESPRKLVVALDGDAAREGYALMLQLQMMGKDNVGWVCLPPGEDPGSWRIVL